MRKKPPKHFDSITHIEGYYNWLKKINNNNHNPNLYMYTFKLISHSPLCSKHTAHTLWQAKFMSFSANARLMTSNASNSSCFFSALSSVSLELSLRALARRHKTSSFSTSTCSLRNASTSLKLWLSYRLSASVMICVILAASFDCCGSGGEREERENLKN